MAGTFAFVSAEISSIFDDEPLFEPLPGQPPGIVANCKRFKNCEFTNGLFCVAELSVRKKLISQSLLRARRRLTKILICRLYIDGWSFNLEVRSLLRDWRRETKVNV